MKIILLYPLRFYKRFISPLLPIACRFHPTCSAYARGAIERHGPAAGLYLGIRRLLRCNPWSGHGGIDPVPEAFAWRDLLGYKPLSSISARKKT